MRLKRIAEAVMWLPGFAPEDDPIAVDGFAGQEWKGEIIAFLSKEARQSRRHDFLARVECIRLRWPVRRSHQVRGQLQRHRPSKAGGRKLAKKQMNDYLKIYWLAVLSYFVIGGLLAFLFEEVAHGSIPNTKTERIYAYWFVSAWGIAIFYFVITVKEWLEYKQQKTNA